MAVMNINMQRFMSLVDNYNYKDGCLCFYLWLVSVLDVYEVTLPEVGPVETNNNSTKHT